MLRCILLTSYYILFRALGKTDEVSLSDEGIESHDLDRDGDVMPPTPKKIHVKITETNETQEQITARELDIHILQKHLIKPLKYVMLHCSIMYLRA